MLISRRKHLLHKETTTMPKPVTIKEKLAIILRFLATGESYKSLMYQNRVSDSIIFLFPPFILEIRYNFFIDEFMRLPSTENDWLKIEAESEELQQFPNCIGALDGKHIALFHALLVGLSYYNYKGFQSIVLMALDDANYKFLYMDIGCQGCLSDGVADQNGSFYESLT